MTVVAFRVDATRESGFGNLTRSAAIAAALAEYGHQPVFVCKAPSLAPEYLSRNGYGNVETFDNAEDEQDAVLGQGPGIVIYDTGSTSHKTIAPYKENGVYVITFDDVGDGRYLADIVVDANLTEKTNPKKMDTPTRYLLGPKYVIFGKATLAARRKRKRIEDFRHLIVSCGGTDPENITSRAVAALSAFDTDVDVEVVLGPGFAPAQELNAVIVNSPREFDISEDPDDFSLRLRRADAGIISGGLTMCEAAFLGLPSIVISQHETQARNVRAFAEAGAVIDLGAPARKPERNPFAEISAALKNIQDPSVRARMSAAGSKYVDGKGISRVVQEVKRLVGT